jgi:hypothetical protein
MLAKTSPWDWRTCTLLVAALELADQRDVHAADEADLAGLAGHGGHHADQEAAFVLLEHDRLCTLGSLTTESMMANCSLGNSLATFSMPSLREADADDGLAPARPCGAGLLALRSLEISNSR